MKFEEALQHIANAAVTVTLTGAALFALDCCGQEAVGRRIVGTGLVIGAAAYAGITIKELCAPRRTTQQSD